MTKMIHVFGDITKIPVDVIVTAANKNLSGGSGVDGAIHKAAGPKLIEVCRKIGFCSPGLAKATKAFQLPAKWVIHTVGPKAGDRGAKKILRQCYRQSLLLASSLGAKNISFPAISTGSYAYDRREAAEIAIETVKEYVSDNPDTFSEIIFVVFDEENNNLYDAILNQVIPFSI